MGNCMETCLPRQAQEQVLEERRPEADEEEVQVLSGENKAVDGGSGSSEDVGEVGKGGGGGVKVKIVLTKEELVWLMTQLKSDGQKKLENMLEEMEMGRSEVGREGGNKGWKPSLESIMEVPEFLEMDRSTSARL